MGGEEGVSVLLRASASRRASGVYKNQRYAKETGEAPPAAEKASRFRGSGAIGGPEGAGNRNAATVYDMRYFAMDLAGERRGFAATWVERKV